MKRASKKRRTSICSTKYFESVWQFSSRSFAVVPCIYRRYILIRRLSSTRHITNGSISIVGLDDINLGAKISWSRTNILELFCALKYCYFRFGRREGSSKRSLSAWSVFFSSRTGVTFIRPSCASVQLAAFFFLPYLSLVWYWHSCCTGLFEILHLFINLIPLLFQRYLKLLGASIVHLSRKFLPLNFSWWLQQPGKAVEPRSVHKTSFVHVNRQYQKGKVSWRFICEKTSSAKLCTVMPNSLTYTRTYCRRRVRDKKSPSSTIFMVDQLTELPIQRGIIQAMATLHAPSNSALRLLGRWGVNFVNFSDH